MHRILNGYLDMHYIGEFILRFIVRIIVNMVRVTRVQFRKPTKNTSEWRPYAQLWSKYHSRALDLVPSVDAINIGVDPFARNCTWCYPFTNDINIDTEAEDHLDAEAYLEQLEKTQGRGSFLIGLLDPPFSDRMHKELYQTEEVGSSNLYSSDSRKIRNIGWLLGNLICHGGYIIKAGYNTNRPHPCFDLVEVRICALGASRNDVLFSVWKKNQKTLEDIFDAS